MRQTLNLLCIVGTLAGCLDIDMENSDVDVDVDYGIEVQEITGVPVSDCYYSGSTQWCQDYYSKKWCTNAKTASSVWDSDTGCKWHGWDSTGYLWCEGSGQWAGWLYSRHTHRHCP